MIKSLHKKKDESWEEFKGREDKMYGKGEGKVEKKRRRRGGGEGRIEIKGSGGGESFAGRKGCTEIIRDNGG